MTNSETIDFAYFCDVIEDNFLINTEAPDLHSVYHEICDSFNEEFEGEDIEDIKSAVFHYVYNRSGYYESHFITDEDQQDFMENVLNSYYDNNIINNEDEGIELEPDDYDELRQNWIDMTTENIIEPYLESHEGWILDMFAGNNLATIIESYA